MLRVQLGLQFRPDIPGMRISAIRHAVWCCWPDLRNSSADANACERQSDRFQHALQCAAHQVIIIDESPYFVSVGWP